MRNVKYWANVVENNTVVTSEIKSVDHEVENVLIKYLRIDCRFVRELRALMCKDLKSVDCVVLASICEMNELSLQIHWALLYPFYFDILFNIKFKNPISSLIPRRY